MMKLYLNRSGTRSKFMQSKEQVVIEKAECYNKYMGIETLSDRRPSMSQDPNRVVVSI